MPSSHSLSRTSNLAPTVPPRAQTWHTGDDPGPMEHFEWREVDDYSQLARHSHDIHDALRRSTRREVRTLAHHTLHLALYLQALDDFITVGQPRPNLSYDHIKNTLDACGDCIERRARTGEDVPSNPNNRQTLTAERGQTVEEELCADLKMHIRTIQVFLKLRSYQTFVNIEAALRQQSRRESNPDLILQSSSAANGTQVNPYMATPSQQFPHLDAIRSTEMNIAQQSQSASGHVEQESSETNTFNIGDELNDDQVGRAVQELRSIRRQETDQTLVGTTMRASTWNSAAISNPFNTPPPRRWTTDDGHRPFSGVHSQWPLPIFPPRRGSCQSSSVLSPISPTPPQRPSSPISSMNDRSSRRNSSYSVQSYPTSFGYSAHPGLDFHDLASNVQVYVTNSYATHADLSHAEIDSATTYD